MENFIDIAFTFDKKVIIGTLAAIASLLEFADKTTHYNIYCVCPDKLETTKIRLFEKLVKYYDIKSKIQFVFVKNIFDSPLAGLRGITNTTFVRLLLPQLLPNLDKIIYSDIDVLFFKDLSCLSQYELKDNYIAALPAIGVSNVWEYLRTKIPYWDKYFLNYKDKYINAGLLIMNLEKMRNENLVERWIELGKEKFIYHDQDILNITCKDKILYLPTEYVSFYAYMKENEKVNKKSLLLHFNVPIKPWQITEFRGKNLWLQYVTHNSFFRKYCLPDLIFMNLKYLLF